MRTVAILFLALALGCGRAPEPVKPSERNFDVKGIVREIVTNEVVIEHETIPDFMDAMTMPFPVKNPNLLRGVAVDDQVRFHLIVTETDSWISSIQKLGVTTNATPAPQVEAESLHAGDAVPDFVLTDQDGRPVRLKDFRGKVVVVTFIFTRCPLPNYCPLMTRNFSVLQKQLKPGAFHLLSISFDPEHDTPATLKEYAANFTQDLHDWTLATGTPEQIKNIAGMFGLAYETEAGSITHNLRTALIDPHGWLVHIWKSNVWTIQEVQDMVAEIKPN